MNGEAFVPKEATISKEEWTEQSKEIHDLSEELFSVLEKKYGNDLRNGYFRQYGLIAHVIQKRIAESGIDDKEASRYTAWHILAGGGTSQEYSPFVDFPGDLSIKKFLEEKIAELKEQTELV